MNKNGYVALAVIALLVLGAWFFYGTRTSSPTIDNNSVETTEENNNANNNTATEDNTMEGDATGTNDETTTEQDTQPEEDDAVGASEEMQYTVSYTDSGYSPSSITVPEGATVVFVNNSSGVMWPASNPHPVHTDYSAFDSRGTIEEGGTYEFTFTEDGEYEYHDHRSPNYGGTIIVN
ncbi:MAG: cupredoxin domain-containing protein [Candidatus Spechtbacterales bacterium]|nr:cupredoxin domain-containing protein [Candidatus Spechtbacterales bacterium]